MKHIHLNPTLLRNLKSCVFFLALQVAAAPLAAQESNVLINNNINVPRNPINPKRHLGIPSGPNGPNGVSQGIQAMINVSVIDNGTLFEQNVQANPAPVLQTQQPVAQAVRAPKPVASAALPKRKPVAKPATLKPAQPKPKTPAAPRRVVPKPKPRVKPATPVRTPAVVATTPKPVVVPVAQAPVSSPPAVQQQVIVAPVNLPVANAVVQTAVVAPAVTMPAAPSVKSSAMSSGSASRASKRQSKRRHGSLSYQAHKKFQKLFAQHGSRKFDPAKCFVWK